MERGEGMSEEGEIYTGLGWGAGLEFESEHNNGFIQALNFAEGWLEACVDLLLVQRANVGL